MHQAGGSGSRKAAVRRAAVRQRGMTSLASSTRPFVVRKTSHSRAVLSVDAVTTRRPSGLNAALFTAFLCPLRTPICLPLSTSHSRAVLSPDAVTTRRPSGLNAALITASFLDGEASRRRRSLQHSREASRGERCPSLRDEHERGRWRLPLEATQCPHLTAGQGMGAGRANPRTRASTKLEFLDPADQRGFSLTPLARLAQRSKSTTVTVTSGRSLSTARATFSIPIGYGSGMNS